MSNIQLYRPQEHSLSLTPQEAEIKFALSRTKIIQMDKSHLFDVVKNAVNKAYVMARYSIPDAAELQVIVTETTKLLVERHGGLRDCEIDIAFRNGLLGDYGDFKGLSVITFCNWVAAYLKNEKRIMMINSGEETEVEPTDKQKHEITRNLVISMFKNYLKGADIEIASPTTYDSLNELKMINFSKEEKNGFMKQAEIQVKNELELKKNTSYDISIWRKIKETLEGDLSSNILAKAKHLALTVYFKALQAENKKIEEEIDNAVKKLGLEF